MRTKIKQFMEDLENDNSAINVLCLFTELTRFKDSDYFFDRLDTTKFCKAFIDVNPEYETKFTTIERYFRELKADARFIDKLSKDISPNGNI